MRLQILAITIALISALTFSANAQYQNNTSKKHFIGSSLFILGNFSKSNTPDFAQLNLGYRLTPKDAISIELKTWKYAWSLGIPYGSSFEAPDLKFPGHIREVGFALAYQRFWWKGLYTGVHVMSAWQSFVSTESEKIDSGFQIFNTYRLGYHIKLGKNRFFIEPSIAITHRPYHTEMPASFRELDEQWPKFFYGEPGLHFGFNF